MRTVWEHGIFLLLPHTGNHWNEAWHECSGWGMERLGALFVCMCIYACVCVCICIQQYLETFRKCYAVWEKCSIQVESEEVDRHVALECVVCVCSPMDKGWVDALMWHRCILIYIHWQKQQNRFKSSINGMTLLFRVHIYFAVVYQ